MLPAPAMSQITRCPACATSFRVVVDQLRIAQGWVRCGKCGEVFEAPLHLVHGNFVLPTDSVSVPDKVEPAAQTALSQQAISAVTVAPAAPDVDHPTDPELDLPVSTPTPTPAHDALAGVSALSSGPASSVALLEHEEIFVDPPPLDSTASFSSFDSTVTQAVPEADQAPTELQAGTMPFSTLPAGDTLEAHATASQLAADPVAALATEPEAAPEVSFVRDARRKAFWATPLMRGVLVGLAALLLVVLAVQWLMQQKDNLAALHPRLTPALQAFCGKLGCQVRPLRRIESLVIDSSNLSKTAPDTYGLSFVLKNTDAVALEIPSLEVTLTNRQDQALVRRVLSPAQFGATQSTLAARSELPAAIVMNVSGEDAQSAAPLPVAGYRILAFYP